MWALICNPLVNCYIILCSIAPVTPKSSAFHPIHVSTSNISFNKQSSKMEVICTIFTDDFEAALVKQYHQKTDLTKVEMHAAMSVVPDHSLARTVLEACGGG